MMTLALGAAVIFCLTAGPDKDHRPPLGSRTAIVLVAGKPSRKLVETTLAQAAMGPDVRKIKVV